MWVSWTSMLHYIDYNSMAQSSDVAEMTHDTTQNNSASMFILLLVSMPSCSVTEWWMCSWCIIASSLHGKCAKSLMALLFALCLPVHVPPSLIFWHASCVHLFGNKYPCMYSLFVRSQTNLLTCIPCLFIRKQISLHVLSLFISLVVTSCLIHVPIYEITHDEMTSNLEIS